MFKMNVLSYILYSQFIPNLNPNDIAKPDKIDKNGTLKTCSLKSLFGLFFVTTHVLEVLAPYSESSVSDIPNFF